MDNDRVKLILVACGMNPSLKGFNYVISALNYLDEDSSNEVTLNEIYTKIGRENGVSRSAVERDIRYALTKTRSDVWDYKMCNKYIGFHHTSNLATLLNLHFQIKNDCKNRTHVL